MRKIKTRRLECGRQSHGSLVGLGLLALGAATVPLAGQETVSLEGRDRALSPQVEDVFSIGSLSGEVWESFANIGRNDLGFDASGNLYILDAQNSRVVAVDPAGNLIREIGAEGEGPGEFQRPTSIAVHEDGSFVVFDLGHRALMFFDSAGEFIEHRTIEIQQLPGGTLLPDGNGGIFSGSGQGAVIITREGSSAQDGGVPIRRYGPVNSASIDDLYTAWIPPRMDGVSMGAGGGFNLSAMAVVAFRPEFSMGAGRNGQVVLTDSVTYRLKVVGSQGGLTHTLTRPIDPRPVTRADREREMQRRMEALENGSGPRISLNVPGASQGDINRQLQEAQRKQIEEMQFAEEFPVLSAVAVDWEGQIWAERTATDPNQDGPIDIISENHRYLGTIAEGAMAIPHAFGPGGLAVFVEPDELEVPIVKVRRIEMN